MSSFDTFESSLEGSRPIEVYTIAKGSTTWNYTSWGHDVAVGSTIYQAIPIKRTRISQAADQKTRNTVVTVASENAFASQYINTAPGETATVSIFRLQPEELPLFSTQVLIFKGTVQTVSFPRDGYTSEIVVRSLESAKNQVLPRVSYTGMCNHFLYDSGCGVDPGLFNFTGPVTAGGTTTEITVTGANAQADGYWTGGYIATTAGSQDFRLVVNHVGNVLSLLLPFATDVSGATVQVFAGCNHVATGDCKTKFENVAEFGGHPFIPNRNIFASGL